MSTPALLLVGAKVGLLLGAALIFCAAARRTSASQRHLACLSALLGALLMPVLMVALPQWGALPAIGQSTGADGAWSFPVVFIAWAAGVVLITARGAWRTILVRRVIARGRGINNARILQAAIEARREIGTRLPIRMLTGPDFRMPMTTGILRPTLLLPEEAVRWSASRLKSILLHETAHLARRDALVGAVAAAACTLWWCIPLSWWVARRLRLEREMACDDRVIETGARRSGYAALLLDCFKRFRREQPGLSGAAVLDGHRELERRVCALVDVQTNRRAPPRRAVALVVAAAVLTAFFATAGHAGVPTRSEPGSRCGREHGDLGVSISVSAHAAAVGFTR